MDNLTDCAGLDQFARPCGRAHLEPFGEIDRENPAGFLLDFAYRLQLLEGGQAGLVDHEVLAVPHRFDRQIGALVGDGRTGDQMDAVVFQQLRPLFDARNMRKFLHEALQRHRLVARPEADTFRPDVEQARHLIIDMAVIKPDGGEFQDRLAHLMSLCVQTACSAMPCGGSRMDGKECAGCKAATVQTPDQARSGLHDRLVVSPPLCRFG